MFIRERARQKGREYAVVVIFLLALLSNPVAVIFPLALLVADHLQGRKLKESFNGKRLMILLSLAFIVLTAMNLAGNDEARFLRVLEKKRH